MVDDDEPVTAAARVPPTEQAPGFDEASEPTAYSEEALDYFDAAPTEGIEHRSWSAVVGIVALVTVLGAVVAVLVWLVGSSLHEKRALSVAPPPTTTSVPSAGPTSASASSNLPLPPEPYVAPPPASTVTVTVEPPSTTTSVPPLATPEARVAEPIICSLHSQYPQMQPVDLALSLVDRGIYRDYDEARLVVDLVLKDGCHGI